MAEILTAEEFLESQHETVPNIEFDIRQVMIEFARMHVEQALKEASDKATLLTDGEDSRISRYVVSDGNHYSETEIDVNKDSILNSYPLSNIK